MVMVIWGDKFVKKNTKLVKILGNVCFLASMSALAFIAISFVLMLFFRETVTNERFFAKVTPVVLASGFALGMVHRTIYWKLPEEMQEKEKKVEEKAKELSDEELEQEEKRAEKMVRIYRITSGTFLGGTILLLILALIFSQCFNLLAILSMLCGIPFVILKRREFYFQSESLRLSGMSLNRSLEKLAMIEKDLFEHTAREEQEAK